MDLVDYYNWGFYGNSPNKATPTKDINWLEAFTTYRAVRDATFYGITEFIATCKSLFVGYDDTTGQTYLNNIDEQGVDKFVEAINLYNNSLLSFFSNGWKFWNCMQQPAEKINGLQVLQVSIIDITKENFLTNFSTIITDIEINFDDYQILNEEIYKNYINSVADYNYSIKVMFKVFLNCDLETTII